MANRRAQNVWIIDTIGKLTGQPATGNTNLKILSTAFLALDSTGNIQIALVANTANIVFDFRSTPGTNGINSNVFQMGGWNTDDLQVITVVQGTAWLYLG